MELNILCISLSESSLRKEYIQSIFEQNNDCDIFIFPEYFLKLVDFEPFSLSNKLIVWGSKVVDGFNRVHIYNSSELTFAEKQMLTPWEPLLKPAEKTKILNFNGIKIAVLVCFDVEFPELAVKLKKEQIDLLIVPAATEEKLGYDRVSRCAGARAVELGCCVITCHLIGKTSAEVVDENTGNHHMFLPSQSLFNSISPEPQNNIDSGDLIKKFTVDISKIKDQRKILNETNPALRFKC
jgi:predicted amidohydrolase